MSSWPDLAVVAVVNKLTQIRASEMNRAEQDVLSAYVCIVADRLMSDTTTLVIVDARGRGNLVTTLCRVPL
jgi:hypothetical protein